MLIVDGTSFAEDEAKRLVDLLLRDQAPEALSAAAAIEIALREDAEVVELSSAGQAAVVCVLETAWRTGARVP